MYISFVRRMIIATCLLICFGSFAQAQDYISPTKPAETGKSPGLKIKLVDSTAGSQTYVLIFAKGDEVVSGLTEFALTHRVRSAHYTAIGDAVTDPSLTE
jgi:uncharacterized protein